MVLDFIKNIFRKKELTDDEKLVNVITHFITSNYSIEIKDTIFMEGEYIVYRIVNGGPVLFYYYNKNKNLKYYRGLADEIYKYIPDERLNMESNELIGRAFKKLFYKKVKTTSSFVTLKKCRL
jgi:hypothetical protein